MQTLNLLIEQMNKEEARHLKLFLNRTSSKEERKDAHLFDYVRKSREGYDEDKIVAKLYGEGGKNAFYRLKNRLIEDINKSLLLQYFTHQDNNLVLHFLALSRHFQQKTNFDLAFHYLHKAEKKANQILSYELLDLIYSDLIKLSQDALTVNPEEYIEKRKANRENLQRVQEIDDILAVMVYRIKTSANFAKQNVQITELLERTLQQYSEDPKVQESPVFRFKIYHVISRLLLQQHNYMALEEYLVKTYEAFEKEGLFNKNNHDTKLQMLVYLANSLFKNNLFQEALATCERLKEAMNEHGGFLRDKYLIYYYNAQANNYSELDKRRALEILNEAVNNPVILKTPLYSVIIKGNIAQQHFNLQEYKLASKSLIQMKLDDGYNSLDAGFQFRINVAELIIRYEIGDTDALEYLIGQLRKDFKHLLEDPMFQRQLLILTIIERMIYTDRISRDEELLAMVNEVLDNVSDEDAFDTDWINYNQWLRPKLRKAHV